MTTPAHFDDNGASLQADHHYRSKAWLRIACALAAFWIVIGAVVWMVANG